MKISRSLIIKNSIFSVGTALISQIIAFFIIPEFVDRLGEELYGIWFISNVILGYVGIFDFGFTQGILRFIIEAREAEDTQALKRVISSGTLIFFLIGFFLGLAVFIFRYTIIDFFHISAEFVPDAVFLLTVSSIFCIIQWPLKILECHLNAYLKIKELSILQSIGSVVASVVLLVTIIMGMDIRNIKLLHSFILIFNSFAAFLLILWLKIPFPFSFFSAKFSEIRKMSKFSLGMFYNKVLQLISIQIDPIVVGRMVDVAGVSHYSIASKIQNIIISYVQRFMAAILPTVYNLTTQKDHAKLQRLFHQGIRYRTIFISFMAFPAIVFAEPFIDIWMKGQYPWLAKWSAIYCVVPLLIPFALASNMARGMGQLKKVNRVLTIRALVNLAASILLAPVFKVGGPILGTLIASIVVGDIVMFPYFSKLINCEWKPAMKDYLFINGIYVVISGLSYLILKSIPGISGIIISALFMMVAALLSTRFIILNSTEIKDLQNIFSKFLRRKNDE